MGARHHLQLLVLVAIPLFLPLNALTLLRDGKSFFSPP